MKKDDKIKAIFANTWNGLTLQMLGYYHDRCYHYYTGSVENIPEKYKYLLKCCNKKGYVFVFKEN